MKFLLFVLLAGLTGYANFAGLTKIEKVRIADVSDGFKIKVHINKAISKNLKPPLLGGNFIQYSFPNTYVEPSKQIIRPESEMITKAFLYQYNKKTTRLRIFIDGKKLNRKMFDKIRVENISNDSVVIAYDPNIKITKTEKSVEVEEKGSLNILKALESKIKETKEDLKVSGGSNDNLNDFLESREKKTKKVKSSSATSLYGKMFLSLSIVIALVLVAAWVFKKTMAGGGRLSINNKLINVINREYIGPKSYISLVKIMDKYILLGVTNENISTLAEFDDIPEEYVQKLSQSTLAKKVSLKDLKLNRKSEAKLNKAGVFKNIIKDVSSKAKSVKEMTVGNKEVFQKSFDRLEEIAQNTMKRRAEGLEKVEEKDIDDPMLGNIASIIKDKVKNMPQI